MFFRELPETVIPSNVVTQLLLELSTSRNESSKITQISNCLSQMPYAHQATLTTLIQHLNKVIQNDRLKSNIKNLAIIFAPNLMKAPEELQLTVHLSRQRMIIENLLEHANLFVPRRGSLTNPLPRRQSLCRPISKPSWED